MKGLSARALLAVCLGLAACSGSDGAAVLVIVNASPSLTLSRLSATASGGGRELTFNVPLKNATIPPELSFTVDVPKSVTGDFKVSVEAFDANDVSLAKGSGDVTLTAGSVQEIRIDLMGAAGGDGGQDGGADLLPPPDLAGADLTGIDLGPSADLMLANPTTLELVAGALGGPGNSDGTGATARFDFPYGLANDGLGNLYISEVNNNTIRKMVIATGTVTTLAGSPGLNGTSDGVGANARFDTPAGMTTDSSGNLFVADSANHTIRKVVISTGAVTTIAGSPGTSGTGDGTMSGARFDSPSNLVFDPAGNLFISDSNNHMIRKLVISTGAVSRLTGLAGNPGTTDGANTVARFNSPAGITYDGSGNLYISDSLNHTIRKSTTFGTVSTLAGAPTVPGTSNGTGNAAHFNFPTGITYDGSSFLFVSDNTNCAIRAVNTGSALVGLEAGLPGTCGNVDATGNTARFFNPGGIVALGTTDLFVADSANDTIRHIVQSSGVVTTAAGSAPNQGSANGMGAAVRFSGPGALSYEAGSAYVADSNGVLRKVVLADGTVSNFPASSLPANTFRGLVGDGFGNLFVADNTGHAIYKVVGGVASVLAGAVGSPGTGDGMGINAHFNFPAGLTYDGFGNLYVAEQGNHTIRKVVTSSGVVTTLAGQPAVSGTADGTGTSAHFRSPMGIATDGAGNLFVADTGNQTIRQVVISSGAVTTLAGLASSQSFSDGTGNIARFNAPQGLAYDGIGHLIVADTGNHILRKIVIASGVVTTIAGVPGVARVVTGALPGGFSAPAGVAVVAPNDLIVIDFAENAVLRVR